MTDLLWQKAKALDAYYDKVARATIGERPAPIINTFKVGYGLVVEGSPPTLEAIPSDMTAIPLVFFTGTPSLAYSEGRVMARCDIPVGGVVEPKQYSLTGLFDQDGDLIAVALDMPDWVTPSDAHTAFVYIDFPNRSV